MGKMELFSAFATGKTIRLYEGHMNVFVTGRIYGISLESGFSEGQQPQRFIVSILVDECKEHKLYVGKTVSLYIKTTD